jgi:hypothetical protein
MKKTIQTISYLSLSALLFFTGCKKKDSDTVKVSQPPQQVANPISNAAPLSGSIKGTMVASNTYTISNDVIINKGDTVWIQDDVTVYVAAKASFTVRGVLIALGTKSSPINITVPGMSRQDNPNQAAASDPAFSGKWYGINCDTTCTMCIIKWTHIEYTGATITNIPVAGLTAGAPSFAVFFQNPNGIFVFEDSWIYGTVDDAVHVLSGKFSIMRNTFEKQGFNSGESVNVKSGSVGDIAYNLFIGGAVNAIKASNAGATAIQADINTYNNTIIDHGYRNATWAGHGACINYEKQGKGMVYNNLLVNCRTGFRVVNTADTLHLTYGNTYHYGDSLDIVNTYYPVGDVTHPQASDVPSPAAYLPAGYSLGGSFTASASFVSAGNPQFQNFTLPNYNYISYAYVGSYNFHLQATSPAKAIGFTAFSALASVPVNPKFGATEITQPGADMGCYQLNGTGNQH